MQPEVTNCAARGIYFVLNRKQGIPFGPHLKDSKHMEKILFKKGTANMLAYAVMGFCAVAVGYMVATHKSRSTADDMRDIEENTRLASAHKSRSTAVKVDDVVLNVRPDATVEEVVVTVLDARGVTDAGVRNEIKSYFMEGGALRNMLGSCPDQQELATVVNSSITNKLMLSRTNIKRDLINPENMRYNGPRLFASAQRIQAVVENKDRREKDATYVFGAPLLRGEDSRSESTAQTFGYMAL